MYTLTLFLSVIDDDDNLKFTKLYHTYERRVFSIAFGMLEDFHDAEEAAQSALFALARNIKKIDINDEVRTKIYVYKCIKSVCLDMLRKRSRSLDTVSLDDILEKSTGEDVADTVEKNETVARLILIIEALPEIYRDVLSYRYIGDFSVKEIADILQRPIATVKSQLRRGDKLLWQKIKEAGLDEE